MTGDALVGLSLSPTWWRGDAWRSDGHRVAGLVTGEALIDAARLADAAGAHFVFKPDALSLDPAQLRSWPGRTGPDPVVLMTAIARETRAVGLVPTVSTSVHAPYAAARELQTLDQLSAGRAGWNAVTSLGGTEKVGVADLPHQERYARARDMILTVRRLHASYPASAIRLDPEGSFADPGEVHPIERTPTFDVAGPLTVPAVVDEPMPLLHAGGSPAATDLAARFADAVFAMSLEAADGARQRRDLAERAARAGRIRAPRVLPGITLCLAGTRAAAEHRFAAGAEGGGAGAPHWSVVGTPADAADAISRRVEAGAADGVIALPFGGWESVERFADGVLPLLAERGVLAPRQPSLRATMGR
ncbi:MAG: LLM class flavin-dependent oxidoreductase [Microbacterium sp.]